MIYLAVLKRWFLMPLLELLFMLYAQLSAGFVVYEETSTLFVHYFRGVP